MRSKSRFTTLVLLETPGELSSDPCAIALYASRPLSPGATQHSLPSGRYPLLGPVFHRLDRTSLPSALIRSPRRRGRAAPKRWGCQAILCCRGARRGHEDALHEQPVPFEGPPLHRTVPSRLTEDTTVPALRRATSGCGSFASILGCPRHVRLGE